MSLTVIICIITALVSVAANPRILQGFPYVPGLQEKLCFKPYSIKREGEWYRFLSSGFVHGSTWHLLINLFVLWQFGTQTDELFQVYFGKNIAGTLLILFYFSAIIMSSVYSYVKHQDNPNYSAVGASGGTSAIITSLVIYSPWSWFDFPPLPAIVLLFLFIGYSKYMSEKRTDNIAHDIHLYGMIYGIIFLVTISLLIDNQLLLDFWARLMEGPSMP